MQWQSIGRCRREVKWAEESSGPNRGVADRVTGARSGGVGADWRPPTSLDKSGRLEVGGRANQALCRCPPAASDMGLPLRVAGVQGLRGRGPSLSVAVPLLCDTWRNPSGGPNRTGKTPVVRRCECLALYPSGILPQLPPQVLQGSYLLVPYPILLTPRISRRM